MNGLSTTSETAVAYALLTLGTSEDETLTMRRHMAAALHELGYHNGAAEVEASIREHSVKA